MNQLRPYQTVIVAIVIVATVIIGEFFSSTAQFKRMILVAPIGNGKTMIAGACQRLRAPAPASFSPIAARSIAQTSSKLRDLDVSHGIIQAGFPPMPLAIVRVTSVQRLLRRAIRGERIECPRQT
jgi:hypothetical protein